MASREEVAWAAGLFEGEGCLTINHKSYKSGVHSYPRVQMNITDKETLDRFHEVVGVGKIYSHKNGSYLSNKPQWRWQIATKEGVREVIEQLYPWLSERRQARANELLALC